MRCAIYCRVSTQDQNVEAQKRALIRKAESEGWDYEIFEETESTRRSRPVKYNLYNKLLNHEYDLICVYKLDRWARSTQEASREIETLYKKGIPFISLTENIDLSTASGKLQFNIISAFAQFERDIISERTKDAFYIGKDGKKYSVDKKKKVGRPKGSKDKKRRRKSGYYLRWGKK
jgi:putative DNA-invertase from lambdoid prophage Rac